MNNIQVVRYYKDIEVDEDSTENLLVSVLFNRFGFNADFPPNDKTLYFNVGIFSSHGLEIINAFNTFNEVKEFLEEMGVAQ